MSTRNQITWAEASTLVGLLIGIGMPFCWMGSFGFWQTVAQFIVFPLLGGALFASLGAVVTTIESFHRSVKQIEQERRSTESLNKAYGRR